MVDDWWLVVGGGWQWLAVGGWSPLAVGGGWCLAVGGVWWWAVGGPLGRSLRAVLSKKKKSRPLRTALVHKHPLRLVILHYIKDCSVRVRDRGCYCTVWALCGHCVQCPCYET